MKNYRDSDYAANKYASGIVYRFANQTLEVTLEDYLRENPGRTEADFAELKALSDEMYLDEVRSENAQNRKMVSLHSWEETEKCATPSLEAAFLDEQEEAEKYQGRLKIAGAAMEKLTEVQRRRYLLYHVKDLTMRQIADMEGVCHSKIQKSLMGAEKKIQKFLSGE